MRAKAENMLSLLAWLMVALNKTASSMLMAPVVSPKWQNVKDSDFLCSITLTCTHDK
jgi:hypothetical protein